MRYHIYAWILLTGFKYYRCENRYTYIQYFALNLMHIIYALGCVPQIFCTYI